MLNSTAMVFAISILRLSAGEDSIEGTDGQPDKAATACTALEARPHHCLCAPHFLLESGKANLMQGTPYQLVLCVCKLIACCSNHSHGVISGSMSTCNWVSCWERRNHKVLMN